MITRAVVREPESLAAMPADQAFEIVDVQLSELRDGNGTDLLEEGDAWRCRFSGSAIMLLTSGTGSTLAIDLDAARFVQVRRLAAIG